MQSVTTFLAAIAGSAIGMATLIWTIVWAFKSFNKTQQIANYRLYVDKYNALLPPSKYQLWKDAHNGDASAQNAIMPELIEYLNLASEELYLYRAGLIDKHLWQIWRPLIWENICTDFAKTVLENHNYMFLLGEFESEFRAEAGLKNNKTIIAPAHGIDIAHKSLMNTKLLSDSFVDPIFAIIRNISYAVIVIWAGEKIATLPVSGDLRLLFMLPGNFVKYSGLALFYLALFNGCHKMKQMKFGNVVTIVSYCICIAICCLLAPAMIMKQFGKL